VILSQRRERRIGVIWHDLGAVLLTPLRLTCIQSRFRADVSSNREEMCNN